MVGFIKAGERSEFVASSLRELEPYLRAEKARLQNLLERSASPIKRPSVEKVAKFALDLEGRLHQDIETGRAQLQRWLRSGKLQVSQDEHGIHHAKGDLNLRAILADSEKTKPAEQLAGSNSGWYPGEVAGARFRVRTPGSDSGFLSEQGSKPGFDDADRELLDWLTEKALAEFFPPFPLAMSMIDRVRQQRRG